MQENRSLLAYIGIFIRGLLMGAADVVPGVSGGTIAFITGIYEELIDSIRRFNLDALRLLLRFDFRGFWRQVNANFILALLLGILVSIATMAHWVIFMLDQYPEILWSFFLGLILASTWVIVADIPKWDMGLCLFFFMGSLLAFSLMNLAPTEIDATLLNVFIAGSIAICAMILPGISGSFILLLLGMYSAILSAVKNFEIGVIGVFLFGCVVGIMSFSRALSWLFRHYKTQTLVVMSGFLAGSMSKIWPWKFTTVYTLNRHGEPVPVSQTNLSPFNYEALTGQDPFIVWSVLVFVLGMALVILMQKTTNIRH